MGDGTDGLVDRERWVEVLRAMEEERSGGQSGSDVRKNDETVVEE